MKYSSFLLSAALLLLTACAPKTETPVNADISPSVLPISQSTAAPVACEYPDVTYDPTSQEDVIYLAGGCFWGMQEYLETIPGVEKTVVGYANGDWPRNKRVTYEDVVTGQTGFRETVYVAYDSEQVSLDTILFAFYYVIDPTVKDRQGGDIGSQYQTGIYYTNERTKEAIDRITEIEKERYSEILVEIEPLEVFYAAEEYHQNYLDKNPDGVCHISKGQIAWMEQIIVDPADYKRPTQEEIRTRLTELQYRVTQENHTEDAFDNEYWDLFAPGIYVDVVSGEPLFSSLDKFESPSGWPAFSKGIDINTFFFTVDPSDKTERLVVRSRAANSHLGHLYPGDADSPTGNRFCINSAALRFIPYEEMEAAGYGYLQFIFDGEQDPGYKTITPQRAKEMIDAGGVFIIDVREAHEYEESHIPDAISMPISKMNTDSGKAIAARKDSPILIYCRSGNRSKTAASYFAELGFTNIYEFGGIVDWPYEIVEG